MLHHENTLPEDHEGRYVNAVCDTCGAEVRSDCRNYYTANPHISHCHQCYDGLCNQCRDSCEICDKDFCNLHLSTCIECGARVCRLCSNLNRCMACLKTSAPPPPQPEITANAETFLIGVLFCCWLALLGCAVGYIIFKLNT